jgi:hypothetical protein
MNKEEQKKLITEIMNEDAKDGLYEPAKTAVEWLFIQLYLRFEMKGNGREKDKVLEQAKAMEKEQIKKSYSQGFLDSIYMPHKYYNDTYTTTRLSDSSNNIQIIK